MMMMTAYCLNLLDKRVRCRQAFAIIICSAGGILLCAKGEMVETVGKKFGYDVELHLGMEDMTTNFHVAWEESQYHPRNWD